MDLKIFEYTMLDKIFIPVNIYKWRKFEAQKKRCTKQGTDEETKPNGHKNEVTRKSHLSGEKYPFAIGFYHNTHE